MFYGWRFFTRLLAVLLIAYALCGMAVAETAERSIYYKTVPAGFLNRVEESLGALRNAYPVSKEDKEEIKVTVQQIGSDNVSKAWQHVEKLKSKGLGGVHVIAEDLELQDDAVRKTNLRCLVFFESGDQASGKIEVSPESALVLLYRRSLLDRNSEIRYLAATRLYAVAKVSKSGVPEGVKLGLQDAVSSDPDAKIRKLAERLLKALDALSTRKKSNLE